jgi:hypothetical protein
VQQPLSSDVLVVGVGSDAYVSTGDVDGYRRGVEDVLASLDALQYPGIVYLQETPAAHVFAAQTGVCNPDSDTAAPFAAALGRSRCAQEEYRRHCSPFTLSTPSNTIMHHFFVSVCHSL